MGIASWVAKKGAAKGYPKNTAEWYVKIREKQPKLNIYAIIPQIIQIHDFAWSFSPEQIYRVLSRLKSIAYSEHDPSDYQVLLKFCSYLPYIAVNTRREEASQGTRQAFFDAALEGLNEGLGSFKHKAMSLKTTKSKEGVEHHPILRERDKNRSGNMAEKGDNSEQKTASVKGSLDDGYELSEWVVASIPDEIAELEELLSESIPDDKAERADEVVGGFTDGDYELREELVESTSDVDSSLAEALIEAFGEESPFIAELQRIGRYIDQQYPPVNKSEFSVRNFDLPKHHVLFFLCFNGNIRSQAVHFSVDTTELHFAIPDSQEIIDICLSDKKNDKACFHLCLSLLNDPDFRSDIRNYIDEGLVPIIYVIAKGDDRTVRLATLARA